MRMEMHDFPLSDGLFFLLLRGLSLAAGDHVVALNRLLSVDLFPRDGLGPLRLSAASALRAGAGGRLRAALCVPPLSLLPGARAHLFLASYFPVPLAATVCLRLYRDGELLFREPGGEGGRARLSLGNRSGVRAPWRSPRCSARGIYYAAFTCYLLVVAGSRRRGDAAAMAPGRVGRDP